MQRVGAWKSSARIRRGLQACTPLKRKDPGIEVRRLFLIGRLGQFLRTKEANQYIELNERILHGTGGRRLKLLGTLVNPTRERSEWSCRVFSSLPWQLLSRVSSQVRVFMQSRVITVGVTKRAVGCS